MRRLFRWAFNIAAVVSAMLFAGTCALWVRSYWVCERWEEFRLSENGNGHVWLESTLYFGVWRGIVFNRDRELLGSGGCFTPNADERLRMGHPVHTILSGADYAHTARIWKRPGFFLGFEFAHDDSTYFDGRVRESRILVGAPYWFLASSFLLFPSCRLLRKRCGYRAGLCCSCGYDLRATSHRCPECGTVPKAKGVT